ncbi:MAG TPA: nicotianamine synthase family protein [Victivallales bacterium]|nr:nicotianamine synthase family protein [Victivallales bacterium]
MSTNTVKQNIIKFYCSIKDIKKDTILHSKDGSDLDKIYFKMMNLIPSNYPNSKLDLLLQDQKIIEALRIIDAYYTTYSIRKEFELAHFIIKSDNPWKTLKNYKYYSNYVKLIGAEFKGARLNKGDNALFLGSGPCPLTPILLNFLYGINCTGVDQDDDVVKISLELLNSLELNKNIKILNGNHYNSSFFDNWDIIMVGESVRPKNECFEHLSKILKPGIVVSHRINEKGFKRILETPFFHLPQNFQLLSKIYPGLPVYNTAIFYKIT